MNELPKTAAETTVERPWPVRLLSKNIARYVSRMSTLWVEGQVVQLNRRPGARVAFLTLRDTEADMSLTVTLRANVLNDVGADLSPGARVVVRAKPTFWTGRGSLQMEASDIQAVGVGALLARIEELRQVLAAEGLFHPQRKQSLPFLPQRIGLIVAREGQAEHDVVVNARARWPQVQFEIRQVAVQGQYAVGQICQALAELDAHPQVEVIVIARGGGSVEDLLPFSNETLIRAVAQANRPVVSAIGHEQDSPLLDHVADLRASTPTDAARHIVPDVAEERLTLSTGLQRLRRAITARIATEEQHLIALRQRPALANPLTLFDEREEQVLACRDRARRAFTGQLEREKLHISHLHTQARALSPQSTLDRGYAIVQDQAGDVVLNSINTAKGAELDLRLAAGSLRATVNEIHAPANHAPANHAPTDPDSPDQAG